MGRISVIVPIYNVGDYLERCVDSIVNQTYKNLEIILVNDGSSDDSGKICDLYKQKDYRIKVIHKKNSGVSSSRNIGLDYATGEYISFVDGDDWLVYDIYEHCIELFNSSDCEIVDFNCIFSSGLSLKKHNKYIIKNKVISGKEILNNYLYRGQTIEAPFTVWRKMYRKELFQDIRFPEGKINEDIVTNYRLLSKCNMLISTNKIGYYYFQNSNGSLTRNGLKKRDFDLLDACEELIKITQNEKYKAIAYLAKVKLARSYFSLLAKVAFYGIEDQELNKNIVIKDLTNKLRKNIIMLISSPIPMDRKLMAVAICINIKCLSLPLRLYRKIMNKP